MRAFLDRFVGNLSPSALMVSTFFWSWFDLVPFSPLLPAAAGAAADPLVLGVSLLLGSLTLFAFALCGPLRARALDPRIFALEAALLGGVGALLVYTGAATGSTAASIAGALLTGMFQGAGAVVVGCIATCQGKTNALVHLASCLPFNIVFVLLGMFLKPGAAVVLCVALPLLAALSFKIFLERGDNERLLAQTATAPTRPQRATRGATQGSSAPVLLLLLLVTAAFGFVNCRVSFFDASALPGPYFDYSSLVIRAVVAVWVFSAYVFRSRQPYPFLVTAVFLMAAGLFALWLTASGAALPRFAACAVFYTGYAVFDLLIWAIIVIVHHGSAMPLMRFLCFVYAFDELGNAAGSLLGTLVAGKEALALAFGAMGALLVLLAFVVLNQRSAIQNGLHMEVVEELAGPAGETCPAPAHAPNREPAPAPAHPSAVASSDAAARTKAVADRFFLTEREAVVLELLLAGRSAPYIADELGVSQNTVKTHVRHIYDKLDVHSRQELLDLVAQR